MKCKKCKALIHQDTLGYTQEGEMTYKVWYDERSDAITYEHDEFIEGKSGGNFYCRNCGEVLQFDDGDEGVKKILK